jgi:pyruvate carboxylase
MLGLLGTCVRGIDTNIELLVRILVSPAFKVGNLSTEFMEVNRKQL